MIKTICSTCIFNAQDKLHSINVDCVLNRFDIFKQRGEVCEDGISINRLCSACRDDKWGNGKSLEDNITQIESDLKNIYSFLIIDNKDGDVLERLKTSLEDRQTINPRQIVFVYSSDYPLHKITEFFMEYTDGTNIKYNAVKVLEERYDREFFDIGVKSITGMFYTIVENGKKLPTNLIETLYNNIETKLEKIAIVNGPTVHGFTVLKKLHMAVNGNDGGFVEDKLLSLNTDESNLDMIKNWKQLYNDTESLKCLGIE